MLVLQDDCFLFAVLALCVLFAVLGFWGGIAVPAGHDMFDKGLVTFHYPFHLPLVTCLTSSMVICSCTCEAVC
jgi:hypothetical protein